MAKLQTDLDTTLIYILRIDHSHRIILFLLLKDHLNYDLFCNPFIKFKEKDLKNSNCSRRNRWLSTKKGMNDIKPTRTILRVRFIKVGIDEAGIFATKGDDR